jgi:ppGpp synthetase/RelA/SpoT-type nucleotidyltranferase
MARYEAPRFSKKRVNHAGKNLLLEEVDLWEWAETLEIINNWRSAHGFPLNTFQTTLRNKGRIVDPDVIVAQRIKRLSSIELKLRRFPTMTLSQMQDIGGCRAIVSSVDDVVRLVKFYIQSDIKHKLHTQDDYLKNPKITGYRGFHLIYSYFSDRVPTYNGLKIEMQIRSQLQHAWATAVEIVGTFTRQALKSSQGEDDWLRFFALMGSALANWEGTVRVPGTPEDKTRLTEELNIVSDRLDAIGRLRHYGMAPNILERPQARDIISFCFSWIPLKPARREEL